MNSVPEWAVDTVAAHENDGVHTWHVGQRVPVALDLPRSTSHNPHLAAPTVAVVPNRLDKHNDDNSVTDGETFYWVDISVNYADLEGTKTELAAAFAAILAAIPDDAA